MERREPSNVAELRDERRGYCCIEKMNGDKDKCGFFIDMRLLMQLITDKQVADWQ